jgi:hypothetical protein
VEKVKDGVEYDIDREMEFLVFGLNWFDFADEMR